VITCGGWTGGELEQLLKATHASESAIPIGSNEGVLRIELLHRLGVVRGYRLSLCELALDGFECRFGLYGTGVVISGLQAG
jgi:hypothetical protein